MKTKSLSLIIVLSVCLSVCAFADHAVKSNHYTLAPTSIVKEPKSKRDFDIATYIIAAYMKDKKIIVAEQEDDIQFLNKNNTDCFIIPGADLYFVRKELMGDPLKILRAIYKESVMLYMDILFEQDIERYMGIRKLIFPNKNAMIEIEKKYAALMPDGKIPTSSWQNIHSIRSDLLEELIEEQENGEEDGWIIQERAAALSTEKRYQAAGGPPTADEARLKKHYIEETPDVYTDILLINIVAKAYELIYLLDEGIMPMSELTPQEIDFVNTIRPVIEGARDTYFTSDFWAPAERTNYISSHSELPPYVRFGAMVEVLNLILARESARKDMTKKSFDAVMNMHRRIDPNSGFFGFFEGITDTAVLRNLMAERFSAGQYGILHDPTKVKTAAGNLQTTKEWAAVMAFYNEVLENNVKPEYRDGIKDRLRIIAMSDFPIAGHHGTGGKGVGIHSAYIDWNVLKAMAENKEAYAAYFTSWLEHEYRERCMGEAHGELIKPEVDPNYKDALAFIKTVLHGNLRDRFVGLFEKDGSYKSFYYLLHEPLFAKERSEIMAFSGDLFANPQTFAELEIILAELKLAQNDKEVWIRITDEKERERYKALEKDYPFLKVVDQAQYDARLQAAKEKVIKVSFKDDSTMGTLDIAVPKPEAGKVINAFSVFLAAASKDESIIKMVDKATLSAVLAHIEATNYGSPAPVTGGDYGKRLQTYKDSAVALIYA